MNILTIQNTINFKRGLSSKIIFEEKCINPTKVEEFFAKNYNLEAQFNLNKTSAFTNKLCAKIFKDLSQKLGLQFVFPPAIIQYQKENLVDSNSALNFCIPDTKEVLSNDYPFLGRSIFFGNNLDLFDTDLMTECQYKNKQTSSPHFLASYIHEWIHSLQLDLIFKKFGYGGECKYLNTIYPVKNKKISGYNMLQELKGKKLSNTENLIIYDILGEYSTKPYNQYLEVFSETFTKFICESLSGYELRCNPLELINRTPKEFQKILKKICSSTQ